MTNQVDIRTGWGALQRVRGAQTTEEVKKELNIPQIRSLTAIGPEGA